VARTQATATRGLDLYLWRAAPAYFRLPLLNVPTDAISRLRLLRHQFYLVLRASALTLYLPALPRSLLYYCSPSGSLHLCRRFISHLPPRPFLPLLAVVALHHRAAATLTATTLRPDAAFRPACIVFSPSLLTLLFHCTTS